MDVPIDFLKGGVVDASAVLYETREAFLLLDSVF
jgi:hypothetical protein